MKKLVIAVLIIATLVCTLSSCKQKCENCDGTGQGKNYCYYYTVAYGAQLMGENTTHDDLCPDPRCNGYKWVECKDCQGTGKVEK